MATADDYAGWIVQNQAKKGAPEFETVAQAYKLAKGETAPAPAEAPLSEKEAFRQHLEKGADPEAPYKIGSDVAGTLGKYVPAPVAAGAGYLTNVALQAIPALVGGQAGSSMEGVFKTGGRSLMQSALKPSAKDMLTGKGGRAIETMLAGKTGNLLPGANVSGGGVATMQGTANALGREADALIQQSNATVRRAGVYPPVGEAIQKFTNQVNPAADVAAVNDAWSQFLRHPNVQNVGAIPVQVANDLKSGTYRVLGNRAYGELKGAETEAQKAIARGLRQEIERVVPEVAPINAHQSELINAINVAARRNAVSGNKDPATFALLAHNPLAAISLQATRSERLKSALARLLYHGGSPIATAVGAGSMGSMYGQGEGE